MSNFDEILSKFDIRKSSGHKHQAICPAHDDHNPSLSITEKNDILLLHCKAGCKFKDIIAKVGLQNKDFTINQHKHSDNQNMNRTVAQYDYFDENGVLSYSNIKSIDKNGKKHFSFCSYDKNLSKVKNIKGVKHILYRLPELIEAVKQGQQIYIPEGEKDAESIRNLGLEATTNPFGAGKWKSQYNKYLEGADIIILEDNDESGRKNSELLIKELSTVANSIKLIQFIDLPEKSDVSDWLALGHSKEELLDILDEAEFVFHKFNKSKSEDIDAIQKEIYQNEKTPNHEKIIEIVLSKYNLKIAIQKNGQQSFIMYQAGYWNKVEKGIVGQFFKDYLYDKHKTAKTIKEIINSFEFAKDIQIDYEKFDSKETYINLYNCTFDLVNFVPVQHKPEDFFLHKLKYEYNPKATCPKFLNAINQYAGNDNLWINLLQEMMGYCLTGTLEHQVMFWWYGFKGRNGKGTLIRVITNLLGTKFSLPDFNSKQLVEDRFYKGRLKGKRVAVAGDLPKKIYNVSTIKSLTGGDEQTSDVKFGEPESFIPKAKLIFSMNSLPQIDRNENKEPLRKRIIFLFFQNQIENPNTNVEIEIMYELPGIFNWAIEGLKRLEATREFTKHPDSENLLNQFLDELRPEDIFIQQFIKYNEDCDGIFNREIWDKYGDFMDRYTNDKNWRYDRFEYITNQKKLLNLVRENFPKLETETKYAPQYGGKMTFCKNIQLSS